MAVRLSDGASSAARADVLRQAFEPELLLNWACASSAARVRLPSSPGAANCRRASSSSWMSSSSARRADLLSQHRGSLADHDCSSAKAFNHVPEQRLYKGQPPYQACLHMAGGEPEEPEVTESTEKRPT